MSTSHHKAVDDEHTPRADIDARAIVSLDMVRERLTQLVHDKFDPRTIAKPVLEATRGETWATDLE